MEKRTSLQNLVIEKQQSMDESLSTSSTDSDDEFIDDEDEDTIFRGLEENVPDIDKETHSLAIVNLDWSQVRTTDLYVLLSSFLPKGGQIVFVTVYLSEFGLKSMEEEAICGPIGLFVEDVSNSDVKLFGLRGSSHTLLSSNSDVKLYGLRGSSHTLLSIYSKNVP